MVEPDHPSLSIHRQCELLDLPRSSYYRRPAAETDRNFELMRLIDETYTKYPFYGSRQIRNHLRRQGYKVNRKRVQRLMNLMGLASVAPKKKTTIPGREHKIYPYLLRGLNINHVNQVWCSDITFIRLKGGFAYLTVVMDWFSRYVLSWEVSVIMDDGRLLDSLRRSQPHCTIEITDKKGNHRKLLTYRKESAGQKDAFGQASPYDLNYLYGRYQPSGEILLIKYTEIDPLLKEIDYFREN